MSENGGAVQVVSVDDEGRYVVASEALRGVTARAELRGLPVAVLSVAGATRGGKSFLLDFMLRYLKATPSARLDGSWLGADDEPLTGFRWSGGCERVTAGILLWSEPIVLTRENGQKVVVLLMDTQGTFDSASTIRDSTTIFAMSTLLASMQIYNLSTNILEDSLQYLQLFTEYGKLATTANFFGKPFQVLQFLVRDWCYAYQHPFGATGGQQLLDKRLKINDGQAEELKEIREHIHSCFESVQCYLMPHPGLTVATHPKFTGRLADISPEFKEALLNLVPRMFEDNLTLKEINGEEVQVQELVNYFESYMEIFNSDQVPTPVSILKATSSACLETALSYARELYAARMERASDERSMPRDVLLRLHDAASTDARQAYLARRTLATPDKVLECHERLLEELVDRLPNYLALNQAKVERAIAVSKTVYKKHTEEPLCLLLSELEELHHDAVDLAMKEFDDSRLPLEDEDDLIEEDSEDKERKDLQQELKDFSALREKNEAKINAAIAAAIEKYEEGITQTHTVSSLCVHSSHLMTLQRTSKKNAMVLFDSRWRSSESAQNEHRTGLLTQLHERFLEIQSINVTNNENTVEKALTFYENAMTEVLGTALCLHPLDLQKKHKTLYDNTIIEFYSMRTHERGEYGRDNYFLKLIRELPSRLTRFININEEKNKEAVKTAHAFYENGMNIIRGMDPAANVVIEFMGPPDFEVIKRHGIFKPRALSLFRNELREDGPTYSIDEHLNELNKMIESSYNWLLLKLGGNVLMNIATIASLAIPFMRR